MLVKRKTPMSNVRKDATLVEFTQLVFSTTQDFNAHCEQKAKTPFNNT